MRAQIAIVGLVLGLFFASPAAASPVRLTYTGAVTGCFGSCDTFNEVALINLYPVGTPVHFELNFDTVATNLSGSPLTSGLFQIPGGQMTIAGQTYLSFFWQFEIACPAASCFAGGPGVLQEFNPLAASEIRAFFAGASPIFYANFGIDALSGSCLLPCVDGLRLNLTREFTAVPEPGTWLLLSSGLVAMAARRFRVVRRRTSRVD